MRHKKASTKGLSIFLIVAILSVLFFLYGDFIFQEKLFFRSIEKNYSIIEEKNQSISDTYPNGMLFYENIRFPERRITYFIDGECNETRANDSRQAFEILEKNTVLSFSEVEKNKGQIEVSCSDDARELPNEHFIVGEGGPNYIINTGKFNIVSNGTIFLYKDNKCSNPIVAIHEILHVIGFKHSTEKESIMYEVSNCKQKLTNTIIEKIEELYKDEPLPDLSFKDITATKQGKYFSFKVEIVNEGLKFSEQTKFAIYDGDKKITDYNLDSLETGAGRLIKIDNLRVSYSLNQVRFIVDYQNLISELDETNNEKILMLK